MPSASAELSVSRCLLPEPVLRVPTGVADDPLFDDDGGSLPVAGAAEPIALDCALPLLCGRLPRRSSVTVDPIDVVAVIPVELLDAGPEVNAPTEESLDAGSSESATSVPERVLPVAEGLPLAEGLPIDVLLPVDVVLPVDDVADESVPGEPESVGSAHATPGVVAIAAPTPNAIANPPTRPIYLALLMVVPFANLACEVVTCCTAQGRK